MTPSPPEPVTAACSTSNSESAIGVAQTLRDTRRRSPVVRHWRGDYPLPVAVLVVGLVALVVMGSYGLFIQSVDAIDTFSPIPAGIFMVTQSLFFYGVAIWYVVGVWRTSGRHINRSGRSVPGWASRAIVGVLAAQVLYLNGPIVSHTLVSGLKLLDGESDASGYEIRLLNKGKEVVFSGEIDYGSTKDLESVLRATPGIEIIHLESVGGLINEGRAMGRLISRHDLISFTARECSSACVIAYVAGKRRYLGEAGRLGFHSGHIGPMSGTERDSINDDFRAVFADQGIQPNFINQAMKVEPDNIWYPSRDALKAAKVIDAVVNPGYYGTSSISEWISLKDVEFALLSHKLFRVLKNHDLALYQEALGKFVDGMREGLPLVNLQTELRNRLFAVITPRYLPRTPDAELIAYFQTQYDELLELSRINVQYCADFAFPEFAARPVDLASLISKDLKQRDLSSAGDALEAAFVRPVPNDYAQGEQAFIEIFVALSATDPGVGDVLVDAAAYRDQPGKLCSAGSALFGMILAPDRRADAGSVLRYIMSET